MKLTVTDPVHFSTLKKMALSPAHYLAGLSDEHDSASMQLGRLVHYKTLGGSYALYEGQRRGKAWDEFAAAHADQDIFTSTQNEAAERITSAVLGDPMVNRFELLDGYHERQIDWSYLGRRCSSRLDVLGDGRIVELKTTPTAHPDRFAWHARKLSYQAQLAFYRMAAATLGCDARELYIIAVEVKPPFAVQVFRLTAAALEEGEKRCRSWMERVIQCEAANEWPGYAQFVVDLDAQEAPDLDFGDDDTEAA